MKNLFLIIGMPLFAVALVVTVSFFLPKSKYSNDPYHQLVRLLEKEGYRVEIKDIRIGKSKLLTIEQTENITVYFYENKTKMEQSAANIDRGGCAIKTDQFVTNITWASYPHFYKKDNIIALYVGDDNGIISCLKEIYGDQFAGYQY